MSGCRPGKSMDLMRNTRVTKLPVPYFFIRRSFKSDTESATGAILLHCVLQLVTGVSLQTLREDLSLYSQQMKDLKRGPNLKSTLAMYQTVLNLLGIDNKDNPTQNFSGTAMSEADLAASRLEPFWNSGVLFFQGMLLTYFGEHARQGEVFLTKGLDYLTKVFVASPTNPVDFYLKGVSCFAMARQTKKQKYVKLARTCHSKIKRWLDMGNPNVLHYDALLDAEYMAFRGKNFKAIKHFESAILLAARGGFQQDAALASERYGEFQMEVMNDLDEGRYRIRQAIKYWRGWGAMAKVEQLEHKYLELLMPEQPSTIFALGASP